MEFYHQYDTYRYDLNFRGDWTQDFLYHPRDYVYDNGMVYGAIATNYRKEPTDSANIGIYWREAFPLITNHLNINAHQTATNNTAFNIPNNSPVGFVNNDLRSITNGTYSIPYGIAAETIVPGNSGDIVRRGTIEVNLESGGQLLDPVYLNTSNGLTLNRVNTRVRIGRIKRIINTAGRYLISVNFRSLDGIATLSEDDASGDVNWGKISRYEPNQTLSLTSSFNTPIHTDTFFYTTGDPVGTFSIHAHILSLANDANNNVNVSVTLRPVGSSATPTTVLAGTVTNPNRGPRILQRNATALTLTANTSYDLAMTLTVTSDTTFDDFPNIRIYLVGTV